MLIAVLSRASSDWARTSRWSRPRWAVDAVVIAARIRALKNGTSPSSRISLTARTSLLSALSSKCRLLACDIVSIMAANRREWATSANSTGMAATSRIAAIGGASR